MNIYDLPF